MAEQTVTSELRANVWKIEVAEGETVTEGQDVLILESMKMEIPVTAPSAGTVVKLLVAEGDDVEERQPLFTLAE